MSAARPLALLLSLAVPWVCAGESEPSLPGRIEVFTTVAVPVETSAAGLRLAITVYDLDAPARLKASLSAGLPAEEQAAMPLARARVAVLDQETLKDAYTGLMQALRYEIDRNPAIVFDAGAAVVYGVADLEQAILHYRAWRTAKAAETMP